MSRKLYTSFLRLRKKSAQTIVYCPSCSIKGTIEQLPHHVETEHGVQLKTMCPYCVGRYRWRGRRIYSEVNSSHFMECVQNCIRDLKVCIEPTPVQPVTPKDTMLDACATCKKFNPDAKYVRKRDRMNEYIGLYGSLCEKPDLWKVDVNLFDEKKGMYNDIIAIVNRFLRRDLHWFHVFVKSSVFPAFEEEMRKLENEIVILPYWCLCDGLTKDRIVHRHMILACEIGSRFVKVWKNKFRNDENESHMGKKFFRIETAFHLVNAIQYVSQPKSSCDKRTTCGTERDGRSAHFYINKPLSEHAIAFMCLLFSGGVEMLCIQQNKRKNVVEWFGRAKKIDRKWGAPLKVTGFKFLRCVIPLRRDLEPTDEETDMFLIWMNDRIMYLKENPELNALSDAEWYEHQMRKGNTYRFVSDEMYVYVKSQQNVMNQLKMHDESVMEQTLEVRGMYLDMKRKFNELEREKDDSNKKLNAEITLLQEKVLSQHAEFSTEITRLQEKVLSQHTEITRLQEKVLSQHTEITLLRDEIKDLKKQKKIKY